MAKTEQAIDLARIQSVCAARGLNVVAARRLGALLELVPAELEALPSARTLRALAEELGGDGVRHVALAIDETQEE